MSDTGGILMKKEYYDFGRILDKKFIIKEAPRFSAETICDIRYLIHRFKTTNEFQLYYSKFNFCKYRDYIEKELNFIYKQDLVRVLYPCVFVRKDPLSKYELAILINFPY